MKKQVFCVLLFMLTSLLCFSQQGMESTLSDISLSSASERLPPITYNRLLLAMSNPEYPVMPGDVYKLTYLSSHQIFSMEVIVGSDFIINLAIFGKINARNMTFNKIRSIVEQKVEQAYPGSTPSLILVSVGSFQVYLTGEVKQSVNIAAWGLTLLSEVVGQHLTPYSSNRDIEVLPEEGRKRQYDLFKAKRFGMKEEDPYLKPGDTIIVSKRDREVSISGEVRRPGQYQLLPGEGVKELIQYYGDAFTELAAKSRVKIDRLVTGSDKPAEILYLDLSKSYDDEFMLKDLDVVVVPTKIDRLPIVYFEGALGKQLETEEQRELFEREFWLTRDPTPGTTANERKDEHDERVAYANKFLGRGSLKEGWNTDRGKMYIILGKPKQISRYPSGGQVYPLELWFFQAFREFTEKVGIVGKDSSDFDKYIL